MLIYLSGTYASTKGLDYMASCLKYGMPKLYSALTEQRGISLYPKDALLMIDSGAFSWNKMTMLHFGGAPRKSLPPVKEWADKYLQYAVTQDLPSRVIVELDVYASLPRSDIDAMYREATGLLKHAKFLRVYQAMLDDGDLSVLKGWMDAGLDYIGLSHSSIPLWDKIFLLTRNRVKLHGFAVTSRKFLTRYPFFSVDSTAALSVVRYGHVTGKVGFLSKDQAIKKKDQQLLLGRDAKLENAVRMMRQQQDHFTRLWELRGVTWN
jgi:hypothetical protein